MHAYRKHPHPQQNEKKTIHKTISRIQNFLVHNNTYFILCTINIRQYDINIRCTQHLSCNAAHMWRRMKCILSENVKVSIRDDAAAAVAAHTLCAC